MKVLPRHAALLLLALVVRQYYLIQPLPSRLKVQPLSPSITPKPSKLKYENEQSLDNAVKLFQGRFFGAETVLVDESSKSLYILDRYGYLYTSPVPDTTTVDPLLEKIGYVGPGRPLGYHIHPHTGHLIICDSLKGLAQYNLETKTLQILANQDDNGNPVTYANDLDISETTGNIYFSDSTQIPTALNRLGFYDTMMSYLLTAMQGEGTGRLLVHTPAASDSAAAATSSASSTTRVLADGFWFANGVALAKDDSYVLVAETPAKRVWKLWLAGDKAGTKSILIDSLPGYPDGITRASSESTSSNSEDAFWIAIVVPDSPILRIVNKGGKHARWLTSLILQLIPPPVKRFGMVIKVSDDGKVLKMYHDPKGKVISGISGVQEADKKLWMGHLSGDYVSYLEV